MSRFLVILTFFIILPVTAQMTAKYTNEYVVFQRAQDLFEKEQYGASRQEFRVYLDKCTDKNDPTYTKASYYEAISALELQQNDAVALVENFIKNYPESIYKATIYYKLGMYYYGKKDYKTTILWLTRLEKVDILREQQDEYFFKLGYSYFQLKKYTEARNTLYEVKNSKTQYGAPALYYYSHIAYQDKSYQTALEGFLKLKADNMYAAMVPYYICQIYYYQGKYEEVAQFASTLNDSTSKANQKQVNQIIGDSYYRTGKFDQATTYLEQYSKAAKSSRSEDYQLGYTYFKIGQYDKAIKQLDKVTTIKDDMGQLAFYHIAECYVRKNDNTAARKAFDVAANLEFSPKIQEDALYNFAVISYKIDVNPFNEALKALTLYIQKYPESSRKQEVYEYLINVYTQTSNYDEALKSLDKIAKMDIKLGTAYQIIAYNRGTELFLKGNYFKAIDAYELVDKHPVDLVISAKAKYWKSEAHFLSKNYIKAIQGFKSFLDFHTVYMHDLRADAYYNLGYAYLEKEEYKSVIESFKMFLEESKSIKNKEKRLDAYLRLADAHYMLKDNDLAIRFYKEAYEMKIGFEDQALYYISKSYEYKGDYANSIVYLENLINTYTQSKYLMTSMYELGLTYRLQKQDVKALTYFEKVIQDYPESILVKGAMVEIGDIYLKRSDYALAEQMFKKVLESYSSDRKTCADAVNGLINMYKAQLQPERVEEILTQYDCAEFSKDQQEEIYYQAAFDPYVDSAYTQAIPVIEKYLTKFPTGKFQIEMKSYLANAHFQLKHEDTAIKIYRKILEGPTTDFSELAAVRVSKYLYNNKKYDEALMYYTKLENISSKADILKNTHIGLMRCHFISEHWSTASEYANKVLSSSQLTSNIRLEAEFALGVSSYHLTKNVESKKSLTYVITNTTTEIAAESRFLIAEMSFNDRAFDQAATEVKSVISMKPAYDYWIAKGLLLEAKIFVEKGDLFQAEQTLNTVLENYPHQEDGILSDAKKQLEEVMFKKIPPKAEDIAPVETPVEIEIDESKPVDIEDIMEEVQPEKQN